MTFLSTEAAAKQCNLSTRQFRRVAGYLKIQGVQFNRHFIKWRPSDVETIVKEIAVGTNWRKRLSGY